MRPKHHLTSVQKGIYDSQPKETVKQDTEPPQVHTTTEGLEDWREGLEPEILIEIMPHCHDTRAASNYHTGAETKCAYHHRTISRDNR